MLVAVVLAWLNGILVRTVSVDVQFFGETADRSDYRVAGRCRADDSPCCWSSAWSRCSRCRGPAWLVYLTGAGIATQLALGITAWWSSREVDDSVVLTKSAWDGVKDVLVLPGSWPLLLMLVVAVVVAFRGR